MATVQPVISDTPSQVVEQLRLQNNRLVAIIEALAAAAGEATFGDFATAVAAIDLTVLREVSLTRSYPAAPAFPTHG